MPALSDTPAEPGTTRVPARLEGRNTLFSPTIKFVTEYIEPQREQFNKWTTTAPTVKLLTKAARRKKIHLAKVSQQEWLLLHGGSPVGTLTAKGTLPSLISSQGHRITRSKMLTKRVLAASHVPTPRGRVFHAAHPDAALQHFPTMGTAACLKPVESSPNGGIVPGLQTVDELGSAWDVAAAGCRRKGIHQQLILEEHIPGVDLRVYVVGESVIAAIVRVPLYIVGDGRRTLKQLVDAEMQIRQNNAHLAPIQPVVNDEFLSPMGHRLDQVPADGEILLLRPTAETPAGGGIAVDVLPDLAKDLQQLALDGLWAVPGVSAAAVDILTPSVESADGAVVLEVKAAPPLDEFRQPAYGKGRFPHDHLMAQMLKLAPASP